MRSDRGLLGSRLKSTTDGAGLSSEVYVGLVRRRFVVDLSADGLWRIQADKRGGDMRKGLPRSRVFVLLGFEPFRRSNPMLLLTKEISSVAILL